MDINKLFKENQELIAMYLYSLENNLKENGLFLGKLNEIRCV